MIADAVKFHIVQGDPDAATFLAMLGDTTVAGPAQHPRPGNGTTSAAGSRSAARRAAPPPS